MTFRSGDRDRAVVVRADAGSSRRLVSWLCGLSWPFAAGSSIRSPVSRAHCHVRCGRCALVPSSVLWPTSARYAQTRTELHVDDGGEDRPSRLARLSSMRITMLRFGQRPRREAVRHVQNRPVQTTLLTCGALIAGRLRSGVGNGRRGAHVQRCRTRHVHGRSGRCGPGEDEPARAGGRDHGYGLALRIPGAGDRA